MKVFKTILWTTFFWLLVIIGLWVASIFFPHEASIVIPNKVKERILEDAAVQFAIESCEQLQINSEEESTPEEIIPTEEEQIEAPEIEEMAEEEIIEEIIPEKTTKSSILSQPAQTSEDYAALQQRVSYLEEQHDALVKELQEIFSTPLFSQLLNQAYSQAVIGTGE